ncbi:MAG: hypothetical protein VX833_00335 [Actinomycetota bacterium]|nr:hypothetical protein [Actinomycetota bacterium]
MKAATLFFALILLASCSGSGGYLGEPDSPKETVPLAEKSPRETLNEARAEFNSCLSAEGYDRFLGFPDSEGESNAPANQKAYRDALELCNSRSGAGALREGFAESRAERTPEQIEEVNQLMLIALDCLRAKGWDVDDPLPDETGALNLRGLFQNPDRELDMEQARECMTPFRSPRG